MGTCKIVHFLFIWILGQSLSGSDTVPSAPTYIFTQGRNICSYDVSSPHVPNADLKLNCFWTLPTNSPIVLGMILERNTLIVATDTVLYQFALSNNNSRHDKVLAYSPGLISALAIDWISGNIYYADKEQSSVRVMDLDGNHVMTLLSDVQDINGLAVDPIGRQLFWTVHTSGVNSSIGRSNLDGSGRVDKFYQKNNSRPFYLCVDHKDRRLYWSDHNNSTVETLKLDGTNHSIIVKDDNNYPYTVTVNQDLVIWTENIKLMEGEGLSIKLAGIYWTNKMTGSHSQFVHHLALSNIGDVLFYGPYTQPAGHTNTCSGEANGGCSHLCFPTSSSDRICKCSLGYHLASDRTTCVPVFSASQYGANTLFIGDSGRGEIFAMDTVSQQVSAVPIPRQSDIATVLVDSKSQTVFWTNSVDSTVMKAKVDGSNTLAVKIIAGHQIISLEADPYLNLLFYSDLKSGTVASINYSGSNHKTVLRQNNTWSIVADTRNSHLYMTVWGAVSKLMRVNYNGTEKVTLVDSLMSKPRALSIDLKEKLIYWCDIGKIEKAKLDGSFRTSYSYRLSGNAFVGSALSGDYLYLADWSNNNQLKRIHVRTFNLIENFGSDLFLHTTGLFAFSAMEVTATSTPTEVPSSSTSSSSTSSRSEDHSKVLLIGVTVGAAFCLILIVTAVLIAVFCFRKRKRTPPSQDTDLAFENPSYASSAELGLSSRPQYIASVPAGGATAAMAPPLPQKTNLDALKPGEELNRS